MMFPSIILTFIVSCVLCSTAENSTKSIVIEVNGDCATVGKQIAHEHGYRYVRQVRSIACLVEADLEKVAF